MGAEGYVLFLSFFFGMSGVRGKSVGMSAYSRAHERPLFDTYPTDIDINIDALVPDPSWGRGRDVVLIRYMLLLPTNSHNRKTAGH